MYIWPDGGFERTASSNVADSSADFASAISVLIAACEALRLPMRSREMSVKARVSGNEGDNLIGDLSENGGVLVLSC